MAVRRRAGDRPPMPDEAVVLKNPHGSCGHADRLKSAYETTTGSEEPAVSYVVARTGFEPVISALRGRRPEPLDERAVSFGEGRHWLGWRESNPH